MVANVNYKRDFPILKQKINGKPLVYLDSAATSQKPRQVIEAMKQFYEENYSNVHRGMNTLSEKATDEFEKAREKIANFINAKQEEIIFVRNATEGINLIANTFGKVRLGPGDKILLTEMEHHSNIVPWQQLAKDKKCKIDYLPINETGEFELETFEALLDKKPRILAFTHVSNVLGTINPARAMVELAKDNDVPVILDAAQSVPHMPVDVKELDVDFAVFSGHKMLGPSGVGIIYGKEERLQEMPPFITGGDMIREVSFTDATWNDVPWKFEAGTPNIAGAVGLGAAVDYLDKIGMKNIEKRNSEITSYAYAELLQLKDVKIYGPEAEKRSGLVSFNVGDIHPHDVSSILDGDGIEIRSGHMCAMPLLSKLGVESVCRASFHVYNDKSDVDALVKGIEKVEKVFKL